MVAAFEATGSVEDYNATFRTDVSAKVSAAAGVDEAYTNVTIASASVLITATVSIPPGASAATITSSLQSAAGTTAQARASYSELA